MTFSEVILGSSPFIFAKHFGHRARLYELDFDKQPENIAEILDKCYELGVSQLLFNPSDNLANAIDISTKNGNKWSIIGMTNFDTFDDDIALFNKYNTTTIMLDGMHVDKKIEDNDFEAIINCLTEIKNKGYAPAIETRTPFKNLPIIIGSDIMNYFDVLMFPLNFYGYMMDCNFLNNENKDKINSLASGIDKKVIANRTLAAGILKPKEAYEFIKDVGYVDGVCVGIAKASEAEETLSIINSLKD